MYIPLEKIQNLFSNSEKAPVYTYMPNRETMHMLIKRAASVNNVYELFCESFDGYKRMMTMKSQDTIDERIKDIDDY
jgi:hypothetical protein